MTTFPLLISQSIDSITPQTIVIGKDRKGIRGCTMENKIH